MSPFGPRKAPTRIRRKQYPTKEELVKPVPPKPAVRWGTKIDKPMSYAIQYSPESVQDYPSVIVQGLRIQWVTGDRLLPAPYHYNPGLIEREDGLWMAYRAQDERRDSRIGVCRLAGDEVLPEENREIALPDHHGKLGQKEDPRLFWYQGEVWMNYVSWDHKRCCAMAIVRLDRDWNMVKEIKTRWGDNWNPSVFQKNWAFYEASGELRMVYFPAPQHEIVSVDQGGIGQFVSRAKGVHWAWGLPRGGTPPVLHDGRFWSFFHSRLMTPKGRFRYFMGAYAFSTEGVPELVSRKPMLGASEADPNIERLPLVVFPCGAVLRGDEWWISTGVNDVKCAIVRVKHEEVVRGMVACS
jgi:predicted GH43/DUF377 family glycosyl hydrolase